MSKEKKLLKEEIKKNVSLLKDDIRFELSSEIKRRISKLNKKLLEEQNNQIEYVYRKLHAKIVNGYLEQFNVICEKSVRSLLENNNMYEHEIMKPEDTHKHDLLKKLGSGWRITYFGQLLDKNSTSTNYIIISRLKTNNINNESKPTKKKIKRNPSK